MNIVIAQNKLFKIRHKSRYHDSEYKIHTNYGLGLLHFKEIFFKLCNFFPIKVLICVKEKKIAVYILKCSLELQSLSIAG